MEARAFLWRNNGVAELAATVEDKPGLKKGGELSFEVDNSEHWKWYEFEPVFLIVGEVEIVGLVLGFDVAKRDKAVNPQKVLIIKRSIKQNPLLAIAYDKTTEKTTISDPEDNVNLMTQIETALVHANAGRERVPLEGGDPPLTQPPPKDLPIEEMSLIQLAGLYQVLKRQNEQQEKAITQLQNRYDKMEEDVKELIENYIPDLSSELADES